MLIYKITNDVNSKLYIGQTTRTLEERINDHRRMYNSGSDFRIYNAMREYGWDKFHFQIIAEVEDQETLNELEIYYIEKYDTINNGYNMALGGDINPMCSPIIKERHDNKMRTDVVRKKISDSMKQSYVDRGGPTLEHRKHLSENKKALYASARGDEVRAKFRQSFKLSDEHRKALEASLIKSVYCIDEFGNVVAEFNRVKDAASWWQDNGYGEVKYLRTISGTIKRSATGDRYIKGLKWIYRV